MPAILTDQQICSTEVPIAWHELLVDLETFLATERELHDQHVEASPSHTPPDLLALHARLMHRSAALLEPDVLANLTPQANAKLLARATLMLTRLGQCVAANEAQRLDTAGSRILTTFCSDFEATADNLQRIRHTLERLTELASHDLAEIEAVVEKDIEDARRKQRVVWALREEFGLWMDAPSLRENIWRFFSTLHPNSGLQPNEVELIVTGCLVFFCIPYAGTELLTDRFSAADSKTQATVRRFLIRASQFAHRQFAHFPVFGFLRGESLPSELLARLASASQLSIAQIADEISRLTAIVPLQDVDKYVPHDVWGHSWQASMLHYDDIYSVLAKYADPLPFDYEVRTASGETARWCDCFAIGDGQVRVLADRFRGFVEGIVLDRLAIAMTPVVAELIADVAEFRFLELEPDRVHELPNSSLLQSFPAKLDLMLEDVFFYFRQATKVLRLWSQQRQRQRQTIDDLTQRGAQQAAAAAAVAETVEIWQALESELFAPKLIWSVQENSLRVNVITRVALNFLGIHRSTLETYERVSALDVGPLPMRSFRDLLLLSAAVFFEADPPRNLWRVDEFLSLCVVPWCERLAREYAA